MNGPRKIDQNVKNALVRPDHTKLKYLVDGKTAVDTLHQQQIENVPCSPGKCLGSVWMPPRSRPPGVPRPKEELLVHAKDFMEQYYTSLKKLNGPEHQARWSEVQASVKNTGTYDLTYDELCFGAKTAWRNAPRCIGRIQWSKLQVFDARHVTTARGMFEALCNHLKYGTNNGNIRSAITIFPKRTDGKHDFRVWNVQIIRYAGYKQPDGSFIGDPANIEFTELCEKMGWKGKRTHFDVLPLVLSADGNDPEYFEIPPELVLEVNIKHPQYTWFADLGLKWFALPGVSMMVFDCGGLEFTGSPFNGWYMGSEIGARDFCDVSRYNITEKVAKKMGLDTSNSSSLWRDRALVEVNIAVLYSYQSQGVTIMDHHAASESFMIHLENEQRLRGGCPSDWVWLVPPMSGSLCPVFHQEMLLYKLNPSYEYQGDAWKTHEWKGKNLLKPDRPKRKLGLKGVSYAAWFCASLMSKALAKRIRCIVLYGTETGKSERFARTLRDIFNHAFHADVMCMADYDIGSLKKEPLVLVVTSTFGNGDPPENGEEFANNLYAMKYPGGSGNKLKTSEYLRMSSFDGKDELSKASKASLSNIRFSVFGLGSKAYPHFCAFGHFVDKMLGQLGGERILAPGEGDELSGQEESFRHWAQSVFKAACERFHLTDHVNMSEVTGMLSSIDNTWTPEKFRITPLDNKKEVDICDGLSMLHSKKVMPCNVLERLQLQAKNSPRETILVRLDNHGAIEMTYQPGDHIGLFPVNNPKHVKAVLARLHKAPSPDQIIKTEVMRESEQGSVKTWMSFDKMPQCSLRTALSRYLDLTTPPSQGLLKLLSSQASRNKERERLELLASDSQVYEAWRNKNIPTLMDVLTEFSSVKVPPSLLLTQLPILQQRYYSISSSPSMYPGEVHATVAVVKYKSQGGREREGVCSTWLNRCGVGETVYGAMRAAPKFRLPEDGTLPIIMVGAGTGIAPYRSFWQQRKTDLEMKPVPKHGERQGWGEMVVYFGCRMSKQDNIFAEELTQMKEEKVITDFFLALSREPRQAKVYVQDILLKNAKRVCDAIMKCGGHFYVCGDMTMAGDVTRTLGRIFAEQEGISADEAEGYILKMRDENRFHEDIFGVAQKNTSRDQNEGNEPGTVTEEPGTSSSANSKMVSSTEAAGETPVRSSVCIII